MIYYIVLYHIVSYSARLPYNVCCMRVSTDPRADLEDMASLDGLQGGLKELLGLSRRIQQYVRAVQSGKASPLS